MLAVNNRFDVVTNSNEATRTLLWLDGAESPKEPRARSLHLSLASQLQSMVYLCLFREACSNSASFRKRGKPFDTPNSA